MNRLLRPLSSGQRCKYKKGSAILAEETSVDMRLLASQKHYELELDWLVAEETEDLRRRET